MRKFVTLSVVLALTACASQPKRDLDFERLQGDWRALESREDRARAPLESARVDDAIGAIQAVPKSDRELRKHLADMAELRIAIYSAAVAAARDRERLAALETEHQSIMLEATRRDAELSRLEAEKLRLQSLARAEEAERLREEADAERVRSDEVSADAELARQEAEAARRLADARGREASLARQEADLASQQARSLQQQMAMLRPVTTDRGQMLTLGDVFFSSGQADLKAEARSNLGPVLDFINRFPGRPVTIEGHTDDRGADDANLALSERRASSVRDALVAMGADGARITVHGRGEALPVADNASSEGRSRNRRVEVIVEGQ
jgi:outer membrane protein OmpA-like peptidoglycan-associated protein